MSQPELEPMEAALAAARRALLAGEAPVGACLVVGPHRIVAHNQVIARRDPTAHAEMEVFREAARSLPGWPLADSRLYVTVEPCPMCLGASHYAGAAEVIYALSLEDFHQFSGVELLHGPPVALARQSEQGREQSLELVRVWAERRASA